MLRWMCVLCQKCLQLEQLRFFMHYPSLSTPFPPCFIHQHQAAKARCDSSFDSRRQKNALLNRSFFLLRIIFLLISKLIKQVTQLSHRVLVERGKNMGVDVQSGHDIAVAQQLLYDFRVDSHSE